LNRKALASITGANFTPVLDGQPVETWKPVLVKKNSTLLFDRHKSGARAYLATNPCILPGNWLNSFSTNTRVKAGGHGGRALQKGDSIAFRTSNILSRYRFAGTYGYVYTHLQ
jgi:antagonist of KipI